MDNEQSKGLTLLEKGQKGVIHAIFSRMGLILLLLAFHIFLLVCAFRWFEGFLPHILGGTVIFMTAMVVYLLNSPMDPTAKITWLIVIMLLPLGAGTTMAGLLLIGIGCAPIYPCVIHSTPAHFGEENSQALIGVQMASADVGICCMPPLFGLIANHLSAGLLPVYLAVIHAVMIAMCERLNRKHGE